MQGCTSSASPLSDARSDASGTTYHANFLTLYLPCQRLSISLNISLTLDALRRLLPKGRKNCSLA